MEGIIVDYPYMVDGNNHFKDTVSYEVTTVRLVNKQAILVEHLLKGQSYIIDLLKSGKAKFTASYLFKNSSERDIKVIDPSNISIIENEGEIEAIATQEIYFDFSYNPEVWPSIVVFDDVEIQVNKDSGLNDLWDIGEVFTISKHSRIASYGKLSFNSGNVNYLIDTYCDPKLPNGSLGVKVTEYANEGEKPIEINCSQDIYDELSARPIVAKPRDSKDGMRGAIITQVLTAVYAHMANLENKEDDIHPGLLEHMNSLEDDWQSDTGFCPALSASKQYPYLIEVLKIEED